MWNINIRRGSIWSVKSFNETDENYMGMTFGTSYVLLLSAFIDSKEMKKFTYLKITKSKMPNRLYQTVSLENGEEMYVQIDELNTGDQRALSSYYGRLPLRETNYVIDVTKQYFNLKQQKETSYTEVKEKPVKTERRSNKQQKIRKFGIDIYVTENENVHITDSKRIILSQLAKDDIIYNSQTEDDIRQLSDKYCIYPVKAIREIKNRLVYQHKQKEG